MKKIIISALLFLPLAISAQSTLTPQQQLEQAQKQLEEAQKALDAAKEAQRKLNEAVKQQEAESQKQESQKQENKQPEANTGNPTPSNGWYIPKAEEKTEKKVERPTMSNGVVLKEDPKYLEGAVPTDKDGKVEFTMTTDANGKSAQQIYDILFPYMQGLAQGPQNIKSRVALVNPQEHIIANMMDEWLVFTNTFISLDRTEFRYQLVANISDNSLTVTMKRINYNYEEDRKTGFKEPAENVITDKIALNKKKNDLAKIYGKFRKFTIDRKDQIFKDITNLVKG